jgi:hypothetical protein
VAHSERIGDFVEGDDGRVTPSPFQLAQILLAQATALGELLLRQTLLLPNPGRVAADEFAHVHAQSLGLAGQTSLSTIVRGSLCRLVAFRGEHTALPTPWW